MEIPTHLRSLFTADVEETEESLVIEVPKTEVDAGVIDADETYRVALLPTDSENQRPESPSQSDTHEAPQPPVEEGETRRVEIENIGDQGDGVARVDRGYVIIVPDTEVGERVAVEIEAVNQNVAFASVTERISYYD
ncbi:TRAM domain-containing protein [Halomicroarcula sp. F13]|uniref:TRAM domain-containing protein n=1 Tax=Haloarcula rubra TaxID=2487747 RepID=A0AAW4PVC7_9EURY|nr:TRAM domain-containing protein [Halomicroarcula rubra]MBX0325129.1 TRAM domain-containing protein [Halomicroarcula rubra]